MNIFTFTGHLAQDIIVRSTKKGDAVSSFAVNMDDESNSVGSFAVGVKSGWGKNAATQWVNCSLWGKRADSLAPYLLKGQGVAISGECSLRMYKKNDGSDGASIEVRVQDVTLTGKKEDRAPMTPQMASKSIPKGDGGFDAFDDDSSLPF